MIREQPDECVRSTETLDSFIKVGNKAGSPLTPQILFFQNLSTSPLAEPPHFVEHIRSTLMFLKKHPSPANTLFPGNKALLYKKNEDGLWEKISSPGS